VEEGNINRTVSVLQYAVPLQWCTVVQAVVTGRSTGWSFDLAWFNSVFWAPLSSVFMVLCIVSGYILYVACQWAEPGVIGPWPGWLTVVLQCYDTVGWVIWAVKSSPKWPSVSSGTLNTTVQYTSDRMGAGGLWPTYVVKRVVDKLTVVGCQLPSIGCVIYDPSVSVGVVHVLILFSTSVIAVNTNCNCSTTTVCNTTVMFS